MACLTALFGFLKKLAVFVLIMAILIPLRYRSRNPQYLEIRVFHSILSVQHWLFPDKSRIMLSPEYRAFENMLHMKLSQANHPSDDPLSRIKNLRSSFTMGNIVPKPSQCQIKKEVFKYDRISVDSYWIDYPPRKFDRKSDKILLYLHGGGYILGDLHSHRGVECHLSKIFNMTILHVEYRLSPEYPLPSAVDDTFAVYRGLLRHHISPSQLIIMGDSAGGGLSLLTLQVIRAHRLPIPRGVIVLSPWTDLSVSGKSHKSNREIDVLANGDSIKWVVEHILGPKNSHLSAADPRFSPLFGSFKKFPPMYINVGTSEVLQDDARRVFKKAKQAGVDVTFEEGLHLMHVYPLFFPYCPEARNTLDNINKWIQKIFKKKHK